MTRWPAYLLTSFTFLLLVVPNTGAQVADPVPDWPDHYDPFNVLTYNLEMSEENWDYA